MEGEEAEPRSDEAGQRADTEADPGTGQAVIQPMRGPPMGVDPRKATDHSAMTRPRICGSVASCRVELPMDRNETLA